MGRPKGSKPKEPIGNLVNYQAIGDAPHLSRVLRSVIERRYGGNWTKAAKELGLKPATLRRYGTARKPTKKQYPSGISGKVAAALERLAHQPKSLSLIWALGSPRQWHLLDNYWKWRDQRTLDYVIRNTPRWSMTSIGPEVGGEVQKGVRERRIGELHYLLGLIVLRYTDLINELRDAYAEDGHDDEPGLPPDVLPPVHGITPHMYRSLIRVIEPLLDMRESAFVEQGWEELLASEEKAKKGRKKEPIKKKGPLYDFIWYGIQREIILLHRADDWERVKAPPQHLLSDEPPDWLGRMRQHYNESTDDGSSTLWLDMLNRSGRMRQAIRMAAKFG